MGEIIANLRRALLPTRGQRDVCFAGMGTGETPFRLPMTDQPQLQIQAVFLSLRFFEPTLQSKIFERNGILPDSVEGVDVVHL